MFCSRGLAMWYGWGRGVNFEFAETLLEAPRDTPWNKWFCGVGVPGLLSMWAARVLTVQQFAMPIPRLRRGFYRGHGSSLFSEISLSGTEAWWAGMAILCLAAFLHVHFFWSTHKRLQEYAESVRSIPMLGFIICFLVSMYQAIKVF